MTLLEKNLPYIYADTYMAFLYTYIFNKLCQCEYDSNYFMHRTCLNYDSTSCNPQFQQKVLIYRQWDSWDGFSFRFLRRRILSFPTPRLWAPPSFVPKNRPKPWRNQLRLKLIVDAIMNFIFIIIITHHYHYHHRHHHPSVPP